MKRVLFIGSKKVGFLSLKTLHEIAPDALVSIVTFDDRKDQRSEFDRFVAFSESERLPLNVLTKPSGLGDIVASLRPDMCTVVGWYWIISPHLLARVKDGFVGVHSSLLPKYRGSAPLVWAIINGDDQAGVTLFYFDEGMDTGDIIGQERFEIEADESIMSALAKAERRTQALFRKYYPMLLAGNAPRKGQNHEMATYASRRNPADGRINWGDSNIRIHNFVRAQAPPYPGAYGYYEDRRIVILKTSLFEYPYSGVPGLIARHSDGSIVVGCGKDALRIHAVQIENEEAAPAGKVLGNNKYLA
jgi:methionyl-tRNA formyltransferase